MPKTLRVFWAVCPPQQALDEVAALVRELKKPLAALGLGPAWCRPDGLHVTLKFIGDVAEDTVGEQVAHVERALSAARGGLAAAWVQLGGLGTFGAPDRPAVLFAQVLRAQAGADAAAGPSEPSGLMALQARLEAWLEDLLAADYRRDERAFHPHLTLARFKHGGPRDRARPGRTNDDRAHDDRAQGLRELLQEYAPRRYGPRFRVDELVLFESQLGSDGARYVPLARLPLVDAAGG
ncbi:MAG: RNA 2',3'-cyclic phosphodiesterase [Polyangia bacterium]